MAAGGPHQLIASTPFDELQFSYWVLLIWSAGITDLDVLQRSSPQVHPGRAETMKCSVCY
jgi:hypothetical protein